MPESMTPIRVPDRAALLARYRRGRERSRSLFNLLVDDAYYAQPIGLRHPFVFYEGHIPAFSVNTLVKRALGRPGIDAALERLFARGIDPDGADGRLSEAPGAWPSREAVRSFVAEADRQVLDALERGSRCLGSERAGPRRSAVHDSRARGDAPGNAALPAASPAL